MAMPPPPKATRINQQMVAQNLKLSIATVSRSLQDHPDIAPETKERVLQEAQRLGYRRKPSADAPGAPPATPRTIGVLITCPDRPTANLQLSQLYLLGMSQEATAQNLRLVHEYYPSANEAALLDPVSRPALLAPGNAQGLAILHGASANLVGTLAGMLPTVTVAHLHPDVAADHIDSDHLVGMSTLVSHLAGLGHRRFGYLYHDDTGIVLTRLGSYVRAVSALGLELDQPLALRLPRDPQGGEDLGQPAGIVDGILARIRQGTTAWVCAADSTAYWLHRLLTARGLRIPGDVSITGYDGFEPAPGCPQATTIAVPFAELGRQAIVRLMDRLGQPETPPVQVHIRGRLVVGATTGPAPT